MLFCVDKEAEQIINLLELGCPQFLYIVFNGDKPNGQTNYKSECHNNNNRILFIKPIKGYWKLPI